jgi:type IV pilus assembly protein PilB
MVDMGVEPFLLSSCLILAQAQRLYRKLCPFCRTPVAIDADILRINRIDPDFFQNSTIYKAVGCPKCNNIGFKGRGALMEVLTVNALVREAILLGKGMNEIREMAIKNGMVTMKEAGLRKVRDGVTALEAALEVTGGE